MNNVTNLHDYKKIKQARAATWEEIAMARHPGVSVTETDIEIGDIVEVLDVKMLSLCPGDLLNKHGVVSQKIGSVLMIKFIVKHFDSEDIREMGIMIDCSQVRRVGGYVPPVA